MIKKEPFTVLVVEDERDYRTTLSRRLEAEGYRVLLALDSAMTVRMAMQEVPDIILLDISMPSPDGFAVAHQLRNNRRTGVIPIVFMTARTDEATKETAKLLGARDFVTKPFSTAELLERISRHIRPY